MCFECQDFPLSQACSLFFSRFFWLGTRPGSLADWNPSIHAFLLLAFK